MARGNLIRLLRATRSALTSQAGSSALFAGEPYFVTDENRIAVATAVNAVADVMMASGTRKITVGTAAPSSPAEGDLWVDTN